MTMKKLLSLLILIVLGITLSACGKTSENEHLPDYCQTYSGFMSTVSSDLYELLEEDVNRYNYLSVISEIELTFIKDDPTREMNLDGIQCFQNLTSLTLQGQSFKDISEISALKNIQSISLIDTSIVNINSFKNLSKVKELHIEGSKSLQSVDGVEEMTKLTYLELTNNGIVNIKKLNSLVNLETLILRDNEITHFPDINNLHNLIDLDVRNNNITTLGADLSGLSNLKTFNASNNNICNLSSLDDLVSIEKLFLDNNNLGCEGDTPDFSSLLNAPNLKELYLNDNNLSSISDLAGKDLPLRKLHLQNNLLTDITPISSFTSLEELVLDNNLISNIQNLSGMTNLTVIELRDNLVTDFTDLLSINGLETVHLENNSITFIPPLANKWPNLKDLYLTSNILDDISGIEGHPSIMLLDIRDNGLTEITGLSDLPELQQFDVFTQVDPEDEDPFIEENPNAISKITNSFNNVGLDLLMADESSSLNTLDIGFVTEDNLEIYGSFNNVTSLNIIDLQSMNIDIIDEFSFNSEFIYAIFVQDNNLTDISFLLNNPNLIQLNVSENPVENLTLLSGFDTSDFDNVTLMIARDITYSNDLTNAFIDLPNLITLTLNGTEFNSITNSFNNLNSLEALTINSTTTSVITDSFNDLQPAASDYTISLNGGILGRIDNSFNNGAFYGIQITNQSPIISNTIIVNSFNNTSVSNNTGILISDSKFETIDNSFNNLTTVQFGIISSELNLVTSSFVGTSVTDILSFHGNELQTIDLSGLIRVRSLVLSGNQLTTVAFIDSIPYLETLNLSNQVVGEALPLPLTTIDGINNQPLLTSINLTGLPIEHIDGFKNIGIVRFERDVTENMGIQILTISADSFSGTPLTRISLLDHELTDIAFMSNLNLLTNISLSVNINDYSIFQTLPIKETATSLTIESTQNIGDFSIFYNYSDLEYLGIFSPDTNIVNLDQLDSVTNIFFDNSDNIISFTNSFNNMASLSINHLYFEGYPLLDTIDSSFDTYSELSSALRLPASITILDSFNNVTKVLVINNGEVVPNFDLDSFDSIEEFEFTQPNYNSLTFLNNYVLLSIVEFNEMQNNIIDLDNINIDEVYIDSSAITSISISISVDGEVFIDGSNLALTLNSNNTRFDFNTSASTVTLNTTHSIQRFTGDVHTLILNNSVVSVVHLDSTFIALNVTLNTDLLTDIIGGNNINGSVNNMVVNSTSSILDITAEISETTINNDNLSSGNIFIDGTVIINTLSPTVVLNANVDELYLINDTLESVTLNNQSDVDLLTVGSVLLNNITIESGSNNIIYAVTEVSTFTLETSGVYEINLDGININDITVNSVGATLNFDNNVAILVGNIIAEDVIVDNSNLDSFTLSDISSVSNDLDLSLAGNMDILNLGEATIGTVIFVTNEVNLVIDGTNVGTYDITGLNINSLSIDAPTSSIILVSSSSIITADIIIDDLTITNSNLNVLNLSGLSVVDKIDITAANNISEIHTLGGSVDTLLVNTVVTGLTIDGGNISTTTIVGNSLLSLTAQTGGIINVSGSNNGTLSLDVIATSAQFTLGSSIVSVSNNSDIGLLTIDSNQLTTLLLGNSDVTSMIVYDTATSSFSLSGNNLVDVAIDGRASTINITISLTTDLYLDLAQVNEVDITTNTNNIEIAASASAITINSSTLTDIDIFAAETTLNLDTVSNIQLKARGTYLIINSNSITDIAFNPLSTVNEATFNNVLDTTYTLPDNVSSVIINSDITTLTIGGNDLNSVIINANNLEYINSLNSALFTVNTSSLTPVYEGLYIDLFIQNNIMTGINLSNANIENQLNIESTSLLALDISNSFTSNLGSMLLTILVDDFNLITSDNNVTIVVPVNNTVNISSSVSGSSEIDFNGKELNFDGSNMNYDVINTINLDTVTGIVNELSIDDTAATVFTMDITASLVLVNSSNMLAFNTIGTGSIGELRVDSGTINSVSTNNVLINSLFVSSSKESQILINSRATNISFSNPQISSSVMFTAYNSNNLISTNAKRVFVISTEFADVNLELTLIDSVTVDLGSVNNVTITSSTIPTLTIDATVTTLNLDLDVASLIYLEGDVINTTIEGADISFISTIGFTSDTIKILGTKITNLSSISIDLLNSLQEITIDTLDTSNPSITLNKLQGTGVILFSTLTDQMIIDHYYNTILTTKTNTEIATNFIFNDLLDSYVQSGVNHLNLSIYFSFRDTLELYNDVLNGTLLTSEQYFEDYMIDVLGYATEEDMIASELYTQVDIDNMKLDIDNVLSSSKLIIDTNQIQVEVGIIIDDEAQEEAQIIFTNKGFTIG